MLFISEENLLVGKYVCSMHGVVAENIVKMSRLTNSGFAGIARQTS
jgi:hypothetical protein